VKPVTVLNLHDRRALETTVARLDTDAIGRQLDEGGLSAFARDVVAEELARRVLCGEPFRAARSDCGAPWLLDRLVSYFWVVWYLVWLALVAGRLL
jgi:hypothetical protein